MFSVFRRNQATSSPFSHLHQKVLTVRSFAHLKKAMRWSKVPILVGDHLNNFDYLEDLNDRRIRDAEVIGGACCNGTPKIILEIGTSLGRTTALMAKNAPSATVYTVNIPPDEIEQGGVNVTCAPEIPDIGKAYREMGCENVKQILANTRDWEPDFGPIDVAFIDGCHDADFVYNDTIKILQRCRQGSIILWHDFNPTLTEVYPWIAEVCRGVDRLIIDGLVCGNILHLQDSWVGLYRISNNNRSS